MGKITRFIGNLAAFGSTATGTNRTIFGPKGTPTQSDDLTDNINSDFLAGWELIGPSDKPTKQQFNAMGFTHGQLLSYLHQMGVAEWDGGQEYQIGSIANRAGVLYSCKTADHVSATPPESDEVNWLQSSLTIDSKFVSASGSNANGFFRIWNDGEVEQYGRTISIPSDSVLVQTYPIAFSTVYGVSISKESPPANLGAGELTYTTTATQLTISNGLDTAGQFFFYARGSM